MIYRAKWNASSRPLFAAHGVPTIYQIHKLEIGKIMYLVHNCQLPAYFCELFSINEFIHSHNTRQRKNFHIAPCRTVKRQSTLRFTGPRLWNTIPDEIRFLSSINKFKLAYKSYLINNA